MCEKFWRRLKWAVCGCVVTAAVTSAAFADSGWNVVITLTQGDTQALMRYNPEHVPNGKQYDSADACKAAIDSDKTLQEDLAQVGAAAQKVSARDHSEITLEIGCMRVDDEAQEF